MPTEIEAKMKVGDPELIRRRLEQLGAKRAGERLETNVFFDTPDQKLLHAGEGLRLRTNHDIATGNDEFVITFKGPLQPGDLKSREERELTVEDGDDAAALLDALGYKRVVSFQKKRRSWKLDDCKIELDEVPYLGTYVEVEGPDPNCVMKVREALGLSNEPMIKTGYVSMLMKYMEDHVITSRTIEFPAGK